MACLPAVCLVCQDAHVGQAEAAQANSRRQLWQVLQGVAVQLQQGWEDGAFTGCGFFGRRHGSKSLVAKAQIYKS